MKLVLAAIATCLALVIALAAAAGIFERSAIPLIVIAFALVIGLGAAPVVFSAWSRRAAPHGNSDAGETETIIVRLPTLPPLAQPPMLANPSTSSPVSVPASAQSRRRTLAAPATVRGTTLFTAATTSLTIAPAAPGAGIVFRRTDLPGSPAIPASIANLFPDARHTVLRGAVPNADVHTTEHILSALAGLGITDAALDLHGPEVPIGDGSAAPFVEAILSAGLAELPTASLSPIRVREPIVVRDGAAVIECLPSDGSGTTYEYHLDYGPQGLGAVAAQSASIHLAGEASDEYRREVAPARTFCLAHEAQALRKMGLFAHLSAREMLVIGADGTPIDNQLRFPNEPARHKLLDLIGDLALVGRPVQARIVASRSGHALNQELARRLAALP